MHDACLAWSILRTFRGPAVGTGAGPLAAGPDYLAGNRLRKEAVQAERRDSEAQTIRDLPIAGHLGRCALRNAGRRNDRSSKGPLVPREDDVSIADRISPLEARPELERM
jgi:hypothetical protein